MLFKNKTVLITGASRGIGKAIALKLAAEGANIAILAKSITENEKLGGTIFSAAEAIEKAGGNALPLACDIRFQEQIDEAINKTVQQFGGIDIVINNASAISLSGTLNTDAKRFTLMHSINVQGTFMVTRACIPYLKKGNNPHIVTLSPPINLNPKWFKNHLAYTLSKYNMTMMALGWAAELSGDGIASNSLWPKTTINTAAVRNLLGGAALANMSRKPEIVADAVFYIVSQPAATFTGNSFIDEAVLSAAGVTDFEPYSVVPGTKLYTDLFLDE